MGKSDWFPRSTWSEHDRDVFNARLKRCREKGWYLYYQGIHFAELRLYDAAIEVLDRMFAEHPTMVYLAGAHLQKAKCLRDIGRYEAAVDEYRIVLQTEREFPSVKTNGWLDYVSLIIDREMTELYQEAVNVLDEFRYDTGLRFANIDYLLCAIKSQIAEIRGESTDAKEFAKLALREAEKTHSGLRYHPTVGLVGANAKYIDKMKALASSQEEGESR
jgi:tetratricopeptide (TPR) repeat protein